MPVECLGMTFENEDILALSDPPYYTARPVKSGVYFTGAIFAMSLLLSAPCPLLYALCPFPLLYALYFLLFTLCAMPYALCPLHHACYSTGVRRFFEQVSHKTPPTHIEGGAFLFCSGKPNFSIVIHSRKQRPCFIGYAVDRGE